MAFLGWDPVFNKFKEKLGNFKKALSRTIDDKAVDIEPVVESVPEAEEGFEEDIEPIPEEEALETLTEEESYEAEPVTAAPATAGIEDRKKAEYRKKLENRKKAIESKTEEENVPENITEEKSHFSKNSRK